MPTKVNGSFGSMGQTAIGGSQQVHGLIQEHKRSPGNTLLDMRCGGPPVRSSQSALLRKSSLFWSIGLVALLVMALSLFLLATVGTNSLPLQVINVASAVVGLATPVLALVEQRKYV